MASGQSSSGGLAVTFFGTCPTNWEDLNPDQRDSCIAQVQLSRQIEGHYAWVAAGELARQWNDKGYEEYSAVIEYGRLHIGRSSFGRDRIASHELLLLSTTPSRESAIPFVVITSKNIKRAQETVNRLQKHPRLCKFGFRYMIRQGGLRLTAGDPSPAGLSPSGSLRSLCGARIAVYKFAGGSRDQKKNVATIGGVFRLGPKHFALTAAHVFFDNVASTGSWADSGLYVSAGSSSTSDQVSLQPKVSGSYEIFVESIWHHGTSDGWRQQDHGTSIGLFEPRVPHRRKDPGTTTLSEVIWNFEMDWAVFELRDPGMWGPNALQCSSEVKLALRAPAADQGPPTGEVLIAAGVSGLVHGTGLGTVGGIKLPWSGHETQAWSIETEIAVGDCGSVAICPDDGTAYGFVVAHDSETMITYCIPASTVLESVLSDCGLPGLSLQDLFESTSLRGGGMSSDAEPMTNIEGRQAPFGQSVGDSILEEFAKILGVYTMQNFEGKRYILTLPLQQWLLTEGNRNASHLDLILDSVYAHSIMVPIEANMMSSGRQKCLLVFSILLELGRGDLIDRFEIYGLTDRCLPFTLAQVADVLARIELPYANEVAQKFSEKQWSYLPMLFEYGATSVCNSQIIIPIHQKQRINDKGGIATLWRIVVPEAFVGQDLRQKASSARFGDPSDALGYRYQFALKAFEPRALSLFDNERAAFRALKGIEGTIRHLCDYSQDADGFSDTYNIVLEYGELDLDEYFFSRDPPVQSTYIAKFWENMLGIASAVSNIHQFTKRRAGVLQNYKGWHCDIKPDNILCVRETFKLADLGFARFERSATSTTSASGGTRTYGSPEHHDGSQIAAQVSQAVDIWSLGCVFSLAATWLVFGSPGIEEFHKKRVEGRKTADMQRNQSDQTAFEGDIFHDNKAVLPGVLEWHSLLRGCTRRSDYITGSILDLVDSHMLVGDPALRIKSLDLYARMVDILSRAEPQLSPRVQVMPLLPRGSRTAPNRQVTEGSTAVEDRTSPAGSMLYPSESVSIVLPPSPTPEDVQRTPISNEEARIRRSTTGQAPLYQTVLQAQKEMRTKTNRLLRRPRSESKDDFLEKHLFNRDISFLVDNAESMTEHWEEAITVLTTLMAKLKGIEQDGIDLWFTTGPVQLHNVTKSKQLYETMRNKSAMPSRGVHTNMSRSLGDILSSYLEQRKRKPWPRTSRVFLKGFTLIVLTDGIWEGMRHEDAIDRTIAEFYKSLRDIEGHSLVQRPVSVEFIRFGDDKHAASLLERLDKELKFNGIPDVIDTTPSNGNIYKMLLGSFLEEYDDSEP